MRRRRVLKTTKCQLIKLIRNKCEIQTARSEKSKHKNKLEIRWEKPKYPPERENGMERGVGKGALLFDCCCGESIKIAKHKIIYNLQLKLTQVQIVK